MTTIADAGSSIDNGAFLVFIVWFVTAVVFAWIGATFGPSWRHKCGTRCDECDRAALKPLTDKEIARGIDMLQRHLERRRGQS